MHQPCPQPAVNRRRIYPLSPRDLTEEQIAVTFALSSRQPEPFNEIARQVSAERAADFNERWVIDYGHASVAEHAILHLAIENISRLACDALEDNRLASYTEKSSRYQIIDPDSFHIPHELDAHTDLRRQYITSCRQLFAAYRQLLDGVTANLQKKSPRRDNERESAYARRIQHQAADACRAILPAATLTNVGFTANARTMEYAISKLLSSPLAEEHDIGEELREQGRHITPTLVKYADCNPYLAKPRRSATYGQRSRDEPEVSVRLLDYDRDALSKLTAALLFRQGAGYSEAQSQASAMSEAEQLAMLHNALELIGLHDAAPREFELVGYTFEFTFDYGALREFRRHRMQTYLSQPLTVANGYATPPPVSEAGMDAIFDRAISITESLCYALRDEFPHLAQYLVTHAHRQRVLSRMSLRECYHLFKLRSSRQAHASIRQPIIAAMQQAVAVQPELFRHLLLRDAPDWWPFPKK